ncbi:hypothetical protein NPX13_g1558 [Xylaria arbuscula]|uniref:Uncharacterized protein n=1 Tax=Xylaria arbuscula TaxID=114810 RepID=A0A9W8TPI9_9PEZI|nr:hypothetical protein NPX13_g1558 [Xylaria arbuscula]
MLTKVITQSIRSFPRPCHYDSVRRSWLFIAVITVLLVWHLRAQVGTNNPSLQEVQKCAIDNAHADLSFLDSAKPIQTDEFLERRDRLARALVVADADAFVLEPGYTFQYYGNISQTDWEPWEPEERPFLMLILPIVSPSGHISAKTAFLAPHFEEGRVRMLGIPSREDDLDIVIWEEHWDPYATLFESRIFASFNSTTGRRAPRLVVDEELRDFISRGRARPPNKEPSRSGGTPCR